MKLELDENERRLIVEALHIMRSRISHRAGTPLGSQLYNELLELEGRMEIMAVSSRVQKVLDGTPRPTSNDFTCYWCKERVPSSQMETHIPECQQQSPLYQPNMIKYLKEIVNG